MKLFSSLQTLRVFERAAQFENFSKAAEALGITTGAVSQHIKTLEIRLGFPLFNRVGRGVKLTESGRKVYRSLIEGFALIEQTVEQEKYKQNDKQLIISVQPGFAIRFLFARLGDFQAQYPDIDVSLNTINDPLNFELYHAHAGLHYRLIRADEPPLFIEQMLPVCSPGFFAKHRLHRLTDQQRLAQLPALPLLWDESPMLNQYGYTWRYWGEQMGIALTPPKQMRHSLSNVTLQRAELGHGIALGRSALVVDALNNGLLQPLFSPRMPIINNPFGYYWRDNPQFNQIAALLTFKDWIKSLRVM